MNLLEMYFSPSGRINRSTFWLQGVLLLNVIWVVVWFIWAEMTGLTDLLLAIIEFDFSGITYVIDRMEDNLFGLFVLPMIFLGIWWWNNFVITAKRLHDRDKSAGWIALWWAISVFGGLLTFGIASIVVAIWMFIELGFLEGTPGPNRYDHPGGYTPRASAYGPGNQSGYTPQLRGAAQRMPGRQRACPFCGEFIPNAATICRYCGSDVPTPRQSAVRRTKNCPFCAETIMFQAKKCRYCGSDIPDTQAQGPAPMPQPTRPAATSQAASPAPTVRRMKTCPSCAESIAYEEFKCRYCGQDVPN